MSTTEKHDVPIGIAPGIARWVEALADEARMKGTSPVLFGAADMDRDEAIEAFRNWCVTYLIASELSARGQHDERVDEWSLVLNPPTERTDQ